MRDDNFNIITSFPQLALHAGSHNVSMRIAHLVRREGKGETVMQFILVI